MRASENYEVVRSGGGAGSIYGAVHTRTWIRSRFLCVEHINVGQAWMMRYLDGQIPHIVVDEHLEDMVLIEKNPRRGFTFEDPVEISVDG